MSNINIVVTIDYEIFGNGSGNINHCMIEPTRNILKTAEKYNVPITLMVEIGEYWAFKKEKKGAEVIEKQLRGSLKRNHDIQLHLHPQWIGARYREGKWELNFSKWKTSSLAYEKIKSILKKGKAELEKIADRPSYECIAFRGGAWSIQPEKDLLRALRENGFKIDTTVVPESFFEGKLTYFDFRGVPKRPYWFLEDNLKKDAKKGDLIEVPIAARNYNLLQKIWYKILREIRATSDLNCRGNVEDGDSEKEDRKYMLDISSMSAREMINMVENIENKFNNYSFIPIIAIGHSKDFNNFFHFEKFIKKAKKRGYEFTKFENITRKIS